jgi:oxalate---CoA ligase
MADRAVAGCSSPGELIHLMCASLAARPAVLAPGGDTATYAELAARLDELTRSLSSAGLVPGDRVMTVLPEGAATAQVLLALTGLATCCPVDPMLTEEEYRSRIELVRPVAMAVARGRSPRARAAAEAAGIGLIEIDGSVTVPQVSRITEGRGRGTGQEPLPAGLLLATSGTTGTAKFALIPWPTMLAAARASAKAYCLTPDDRRLNIMPLFHIQGIVGSVLASLVAGGSVSCAASFSPAEVTGSWLEDGVTWFSASPGMHQQIMDAARPSWRPPPLLRFVRCGSAELTARLRQALERFYGVPVVESYGMTEAHQIASTPLSPGSAAGLVPTGCEVAIEAEPGSVTTQPGRRGQVVVRGDNVIPRYHPDDPGAFCGSWFRTGDQGELLADGSLRLTGRIRELIVRGGENIAPREVEDVLRAHPLVRQACVVGVPDPVLGERVCAAVVLAQPGGADHDALRSFARERLAPFKVPEVIVEYGELPATGSGKVARAAVAGQLAAVVPPRVAGAATAISSGNSGAAADALLIMWRQVLRTESLGPDDDFFAAGGDSLASTTLLAAVAERFSVEISPLTMFDEMPTVATMAAYISRQAATVSATVTRLRSP